MDEKEKGFCEELTALLHKYGFGIADEPHIYDLNLSNDIEAAMEYGRKVSIDKENRLHFV